MQITKLFIPLAIMAGAVQAIARPEVVKLSDLETQAKAAPATRKYHNGPSWMTYQGLTNFMQSPQLPKPWKGS
jgi:hypothetical protein